MGENDAAQSPPELPGGPGQVWGPWATLGLSLLIGVGMTVAQVLVALVFAMDMAAHSPDPAATEAWTASLPSNGHVLSLAILAACPPVVALTAGFIKWRGGLSVREYLGLRRVGVASLLAWLGATVALVAATDLTSMALGRPVVPDFMRKAYDSAGFPPLLWLALVAAAPIAEEILFRGFLYRGLSASRLGAAGATVIASILWALLHAEQYDILDIAWIFLFGLLLGWARHCSGSLYPCLGMHALANSIATAEAALIGG